MSTNMYNQSIFPKKIWKNKGLNSGDIMFSSLIIFKYQGLFFLIWTTQAESLSKRPVIQDFALLEATVLSLSMYLHGHKSLILELKHEQGGLIIITCGRLIWRWVQQSANHRAALQVIGQQKSITIAWMTLEAAPLLAALLIQKAEM